MNNDIERVLYSTEDINAAEDRLAKQINADYADKKQLDFIDVSSYYGGTESTGTIKLIHDLKADLKGQDVLIMEDIVDTGRTLRYLVDLLGERGANSVKVCTLLDKPEGRKVEIEADYVGFVVPNEFLVGYGLDYQGYYRNLPYVGILKPSVYSK